MYYQLSVKAHHQFLVFPSSLLAPVSVGPFFIVI
ncbi:unnamed protein product [Acanthoscelides obtectus]|uniref:Uncharacterized protein n=1 Tax=Acanthoscelides obtectus TaxID=200917 RepID=A0A9P0P6Q9_ACAOB|nr:unnamed protein product [Acanthoscelides obtectus]CAK1680363.1 hypothetical protein AOBTE_LOCUS32596 [Acanthoscelides obtectus]